MQSQVMRITSVELPTKRHRSTVDAQHLPVLLAVAMPRPISIGKLVLLSEFRDF